MLTFCTIGRYSIQLSKFNSVVGLKNVTLFDLLVASSRLCNVH